MVTLPLPLPTVALAEVLCWMSSGQGMAGALFLSRNLTFPPGDFLQGVQDERPLCFSFRFLPQVSCFPKGQIMLDPSGSSFYVDLQPVDRHLLPGDQRAMRHTRLSREDTFVSRGTATGGVPSPNSASVRPWRHWKVQWPSSASESASIISGWFQSHVSA